MITNLLSQQTIHLSSGKKFKAEQFQGESHNNLIVAVYFRQSFICLLRWWVNHVDDNSILHQWSVTPRRLWALASSATEQRRFPDMTWQHLQKKKKKS